MAQIGDGHDLPEETGHDGVVRCALCSGTARAGSGSPEWCDVASALLCDACCDALQEGDPRRVLPLVLRTKGALRHEDAVGRCMECPRMVHHVVRNAPGAEAVPPC